MMLKLPVPPAMAIDPLPVTLAPTVLGGGPTVIVKEQLALLPPESVAVHFTVLNPRGKFDPEGWSQLVVTAGQLSVTLGAG